MFPKNIFQILILNRAMDGSSPKALFQMNVGSFKAVYPGAEYRLYMKEEISDFIADHFPRDVLNAFTSLQPYAFKADLARYCLLHKLGGLYSDLSYLHLSPIKVGLMTDLVVFRDIPGIHPSWATSNAVILAGPGNEVLARAIDRIVHCYRTGYTGTHSLDLTGPYMFGRVLAETENWKRIKFGDSRAINAEATSRVNIIKVMPSGEVVAMKNKKRAGISEMIAKGGNSFDLMWRMNRVWDQRKRKAFLSETELETK